MRGFKEVWTGTGFVHIPNDLVDDFYWSENRRARLNLIDNNNTQVNVLWRQFDDREERIGRIDAKYDDLLRKARKSGRQLNFVQKQMTKRGIRKLKLKEL